MEQLQDIRDMHEKMSAEIAENKEMHEAVLGILSTMKKG
jgi:low affinity Fe/Cu permease